MVYSINERTPVGDFVLIGTGPSPEEIEKASSLSNQAQSIVLRNRSRDNEGASKISKPVAPVVSPKAGRKPQVIKKTQHESHVLNHFVPKNLPRPLPVIPISSKPRTSNEVLSTGEIGYYTNINKMMNVRGLDSFRQDIQQAYAKMPKTLKEGISPVIPSIYLLASDTIADKKAKLQNNIDAMKAMLKGMRNLSDEQKNDIKKDIAKLTATHNELDLELLNVADAFFSEQIDDNLKSSPEAHQFAMSALNLLNKALDAFPESNIEDVLEAAQPLIDVIYPSQKEQSTVILHLIRNFREDQVKKGNIKPQAAQKSSEGKKPSATTKAAKTAARVLPPPIPSRENRQSLIAKVSDSGTRVLGASRNEKKEKPVEEYLNEIEEIEDDEFGFEMLDLNQMSLGDLIEEAVRLQRAGKK